MSTRRSTRAASHTSASPAPSGLTTATTSGRTSGRKSVKDIADLPPLPSIAAKPSTAYGSSAIATPLKAALPRAEQDIGAALAEILRPARKPISDAGSKAATVAESSTAGKYL